MKLLIEIPTWLGDAIMATPAIENLIENLKPNEITIVGSFVSTKLFAQDKRITNIIVDESKKSKCRFYGIYNLSKKIKKHDMAISFRSSMTSKLLLWLTKTPKRYTYPKTKNQKHQVLKYNDFINSTFNLSTPAKDLKLTFKVHTYDKPTLGINPGATYGSAKRWYPKEFAKVAIELSSKYDIVIFGGPQEQDIANDIENELLKSGINNYQNLAGKTSIEELIEKIAGLSLFLTNDSGPMHVAAAYKVKTYAIFGPTKYTETNQWNNPNGHIITKNLECAPCMKRVCPLKHHNCMKLITANDLLRKINDEDNNN